MSNERFSKRTSGNIKSSLLGGWLKRTRYVVGLNHYGSFNQKPWIPNDAERHTHKADSWELKELWAKVANECLERTGDEGGAIREPNAVVARQVQAG